MAAVIRRDALGFEDPYARIDAQLEEARAARGLPSMAELAWAGRQELIMKSITTTTAPERSPFDALLDELAAGLGLNKAISVGTDEDDERIARAAGEDGDGDDAATGRDVKIVQLVGKLVQAVSAQGARIQALEAKAGLRGGGGAPGFGPPPDGKPMTKALQGQMDGELFLVKAMAAHAAGRVAGYQVAIAEAHVNAGRQPPADIIRAVLLEE